MDAIRKVRDELQIDLNHPIRKVRDELQTDLNFKGKQTTIESYFNSVIFFFFSFYELLIYDFLGTENYKGISRKIIILLFYRVPSINLKRVSTVVLFKDLLHR